MRAFAGALIVAVRVQQPEACLSKTGSTATTRGLLLTHLLARSVARLLTRLRTHVRTHVRTADICLQRVRIDRDPHTYAALRR